MDMEKYINTGDARTQLKIQQYQLIFLMEHGYLKRQKFGRSFLFDREEVDKFPRHKIVELMRAFRDKESIKQEEWRRKCLFSFKGWDERALVFCDLVKKGYDMEDIMRFMHISEHLRPLVVKKIKYLKGI